MHKYGVASETGQTVHRRRGAELRGAIFDAVLHQLHQVGYAHLTMDGVAAVARTGKAALYRRWSCKQDLVVDAVNALLPPVCPATDRGCVRDELVQLLTSMRDSLNTTNGAVILSLVAAGRRDCDFAQEVRGRLLAPRMALIEDALRRGITRGQVRPDINVSLTVSAGPAMLTHRCLTGGLPIPEDFPVSVVDQVLMPMIQPVTATAPGSLGPDAAVADGAPPDAGLAPAAPAPGSPDAGGPEGGRAVPAQAVLRSAERAGQAAAAPARPGQTPAAAPAR